MVGQDTVALLKRVTIFANVEEQALRELAALVITKDYPKETLVFGQDDPGDSMFVIASGQVKVVLYGENGKEITLTFFRAGDIFGEMALLDDKPRSANVLTTEPSQLLILKREAFIEHLKRCPATAIEVLAVLCQRLRKADEVIGNLALLDVFGRVARVLMDLAKSDGETIDEGVLIRKRPTQQDIASMVNSSRETVSRVLSEFQRRGLLLMDGKKVVLRPQFYDQLG
ncbi:MAG TPA: Crp/Fnr family transcriptional regulator [Myxococcota bacterium]|nr:Crp/Fnr family transcriptional regulator [Myxococcota bacterium]HRY93836.1 Crp/Fnr family transcriptional regulator [Myxococcota bacterium]HSA23478.1 Crp/Fnr family transcriptional regulator [Myxococcota bacterium]